MNKMISYPKKVFLFLLILLIPIGLSIGSNFNLSFDSDKSSINIQNQDSGLIVGKEENLEMYKVKDEQSKHEIFIEYLSSNGSLIAFNSEEPVEILSIKDVVLIENVSNFSEVV